MRNNCWPIAILIGLTLLGVSLVDGAWTEDTVLEANTGDIVPQLAALGLDGFIESTIEAEGGAIKARSLLNRVNDQLGIRGLPTIDLGTLERYVTERVALGELQSLSTGGIPDSRLNAPAEIGIHPQDPTLFAWSNVAGNDGYVVIVRMGKTIIRRAVQANQAPIAVAAELVGAGPGDTFSVQAAARDVTGVLGWFTAPFSHTIPAPDQGGE